MSLLRVRRIRRPEFLREPGEAPGRTGCGEKARWKSAFLPIHPARGISRHCGASRSGRLSASDWAELVDAHHHRKTIRPRLGVGKRTEQDRAERFRRETGLSYRSLSGQGYGSELAGSTI